MADSERQRASWERSCCSGGQLCQSSRTSRVHGSSSACGMHIGPLRALVTATPSHNAMAFALVNCMTQWSGSCMTHVQTTWFVMDCVHLALSSHWVLCFCTIVSSLLYSTCISLELLCSRLLAGSLCTLICGYSCQTGLYMCVWPVVQTAYAW